MDKWEFFTPTYPFVYFLDTRTQRGHLKDGPSGSDQGAPAYLKSVPIMGSHFQEITTTVEKTEQKFYHWSSLPLRQCLALSSLKICRRRYRPLPGPYFRDLLNFGRQTGGSSHAVLASDGQPKHHVASGDVHYAFTSTVKFTVFDDKHCSDAIKLNACRNLLAQTTGRHHPTYDALSTAQFLQLAETH